jgi:hypothetical protein
VFPLYSLTMSVERKKRKPPYRGARSAKAQLRERLRKNEKSAPTLEEFVSTVEKHNVLGSLVALPGAIQKDLESRFTGPLPSNVAEEVVPVPVLDLPSCIESLKTRTVTYTLIVSSGLVPNWAYTSRPNTTSTVRRARGRSQLLGGHERILVVDDETKQLRTS